MVLFTEVLQALMQNLSLHSKLKKYKIQLLETTTTSKCESPKHMKEKDCSGIDSNLDFFK